MISTKLETGVDTPGVCLIDFGVPDGEDATDLDTVLHYHPLGYIADVAEKIKQNHDKMSPQNFARAFGNQRSQSRQAILPDRDLESVTTDTPLTSNQVDFGVAVSMDQSLTAIVAVGEIDGVPAVEVIECRPGHSWVIPALEILERKFPAARFTIDDHGPGLRLSEELQGHDIIQEKLVVAKTEDLISGTESFMHAVEQGPEKILLRRDQALFDEIGAAVLKNIGEKGRALSRSKSLAPVPRLEAAVLALRLAWKTEQQVAAPMVWSPL